MSSMRQIATTPTLKWVASKAVSILRDDPNIGAKRLQNRLQTYHKCEISYDTVWRVKKELLKRFMANGKRVLSCCLGGRPR